MNRSLSTDEKWLIEREFIAREKEKERLRKFRNQVFSVGIVSGFLASALSIVFGGFFIPLLPKISWIACICIYLGADSFLPAFAKHVSPSLIVNPWKESLSRLSDTEDIIRGIALLACFKLSHLFFLFIVYLVK